MKVAIGITAILVTFLMVACQSTDETIAPLPTTTNQTSTTTTTQTSSNTTSKPTNQEIYDAFVRLALKNSSGTQLMTIRKWLPTKAQIKIFWDSGSTTILLSALDKIMADMNSLNKNNKMVRTTVATDADIIINRIDVATHNAKYVSYQITNTSVQGNTFTLWNGTAISKSVIWLSPTTPSNLQNGVLRHELTHALGIGHTENTKSIMIPVMTSTNYDFNTFSILDQRILQILADSRIKQGDSEANISTIIKEYAAK